MRFNESAADESVIGIIGLAFSRQIVLDRDDRATLDTDIDAFCLRTMRAFLIIRSIVVLLRAHSRRCPRIERNNDLS
jgi:hypothetical protein